MAVDQQELHQLTVADACILFMFFARKDEAVYFARNRG